MNNPDQVEDEFFFDNQDKKIRSKIEELMKEFAEPKAQGAFKYNKYEDQTFGEDL